jgi:hypothetical protein
VSTHARSARSDNVSCRSSPKQKKPGILVPGFGLSAVLLED